MNKGEKSFLNAVAALIQMAVTSIIGLFFNKTILSVYGSDYNGINSTVSQIINTLMIFEAGFSLASNVALFKPFSTKDYNGINEILSATKKRFIIIGLIVFLIGILLSMVYPFFATSAMPKITIGILMLTALIPITFNLSFSMKYRVLLLTDQKEYIISIITAVSYLVGNGLAIIFMRNGCSIVVARLIIMTFLLINYFLIIIICKKRYSFIDFSVTPNYKAIKGTNNVIVLKLTSVAYSSAPIIVLSMIPNLGAILASIYAVYKNIISVVRDTLTSITSSPRLSFGAVFSEGRIKDAEKLYSKYELVTCICVSIILGTTCLLFLPFVKLYTSGISDANYIDRLLAIIMLTTAAVEILHIPSGQMIQMKGDFKTSRSIQSIAFIVLIFSMIFGVYFFKLYGVVSSVLIAAIILAVCEIFYTNFRIFKRNPMVLILNLSPCIIICIIASYFGLNEYILISSYVDFIWIGMVSLIIITIITITAYTLVRYKSMRFIFNYGIKLLKIRRKK